MHFKERKKKKKLLLKKLQILIKFYHLHLDSSLLDFINGGLVSNAFLFCNDPSY